MLSGMLLTRFLFFCVVYTNAVRHVATHSSEIEPSSGFVYLYYDLLPSNKQIIQW
jgi:hypothetical protein